MSMQIRASVGRYSNGQKLCYNRLEDKKIVVDLLNQIPEDQGGMVGQYLTPLQPDLLPSPQIEWRLFEAICRFQKANKARYHLQADGHVDPNERTIALMNRLAEEAPPRRSAQGWPPRYQYDFVPLTTGKPYQGSAKDMFFLLDACPRIDPTSKGLIPEALYWFGFPGAVPVVSDGDLQVAQCWGARCHLFRPLPIDRLEGPGTVTETLRNVGSNNSPALEIELFLVLPGSSPRITMTRFDQSPGSGGGGIRHGIFRFVRFPNGSW